MKTTTWVVITAGLITMSACTSRQKSAPEPGINVASAVEEGKDRVERRNVVTMTAVVEDIDHEKRLVTLLGPEGKTTTVQVDKGVKNLPQVHKGDQVIVAYYESLVFQLRKPGEAVPGDAGYVESEARARPGEKPGGMGARALSVVTAVEAIDKENETITLKGPEGRSETMKVQNPANLDKVKVGDTLLITYTQAVAISVEKP